MVTETDISVELKIRAFEIAERTVPNSYSSSSPQVMGTVMPKEIFLRADRIIAWATGTEEVERATLISKLKAVLCEGN